jgi:uncharacterized protein YqcC (DUF446 family)
MNDIPGQIADVLLEIEAELRISGKWQQNQPPMSALASAEPFCVDTLRFEQWLQWVFLPRMRQILEQQQPLPVKSGIYAYAEEALPGDAPSTSRLLALIRRFDDLIAVQSRALGH